VTATLCFCHVDEWTFYPILALSQSAVEALTSLVLYSRIVPVQLNSFKDVWKLRGNCVKNWGCHVPRVTTTPLVVQLVCGFFRSPSGSLLSLTLLITSRRRESCVVLSLCLCFWFLYGAAVFRCFSRVSRLFGFWSVFISREARPLMMICVTINHWAIFSTLCLWHKLVTGLD